MKVSTTLSLTCALIGLASLPTLAQQTTESSNETKNVQTLTHSTPTKATAALQGPIQLASISVLPESLRKTSGNLCQSDAKAPFFPLHANGITLGGFVATDVPDGIDADLGFSISIERQVTAGDRSGVVVSLRYSHYSFASNVPGVAFSGDVNLISPMAGYRYRLGADRRFYIEPGVGIVFVSGRLFSGNANTTNFAYSIAGGYEFQHNLYADLRYVAGGNTTEQGFIFSLGGHF